MTINVGHGARARKRLGQVAHALPTRRIPSRLQPWACRLCTLENEGSAVRCEACRSPRTSGCFPQSPGVLYVQDLYVFQRMLKWESDETCPQ